MEFIGSLLEQTSRICHYHLRHWQAGCDRDVHSWSTSRLRLVVPMCDGPLLHRGRTSCRGGNDTTRVVDHGRFQDTTTMIGMGVVNIAADGRVLPNLTLSKLRPVIAASGSLLPKAIDIYATLILTNLELRERRPTGEKLVVVVNSPSRRGMPFSLSELPSR